ncbi:MAG TPA: hypothetical protein VKS82_14790 [Streptosporangiaceae bacterium]|jgi:hypothetical protein|nr:hypothetical protein [Streptosporangiaceae bacterium]
MATYLLIFRSPHDYKPSPETGAAWSAWHQGLGAQLRDRGNPVFRSQVLGGEVGDTALGGYSLIRAADLDAAVAVAKTCPGLESGMTVEVGEVTNSDDSFDAWLAAHPSG